jgi:hypothetical protein
MSVRCQSYLPPQRSGSFKQVGAQYSQSIAHKAGLGNRALSPLLIVVNCGVICAV